MFEQIKGYIPCCEQEEVDKKAILDFIDRNPDILNRTNKVAHMTSSAIVVNENMTKVLFAYHNIYDSWSWVGGHNDGDSDCLHVAIKETMEETGVQTIQPHSNDIFAIDIIYVCNHIKNGEYIPDHLHLNVTYLLIADETEKLTIAVDENSDVKWFDIDEVIHEISEPRMVPVYQKLFHKIKNIK